MATSNHGIPHHVQQYRSQVPGIAAMTLYSGRTFPRHAHDQYGIGVMTRGAQRSWSVLGQVESQAGDVVMFNPDELHDGAPLGPARGWSILHLDPALVRQAWAGEPIEGDVLLRPVARDAQLARHVARLFAQVTAPRDRMPTDDDAAALEESLLCCLMRAAQRHRVGGAARGEGASPSVAAAVRRLDAEPERPLSLAALAAQAGMSRFQLLRGFAREVGTTPHAYLVQRRVRAARRWLVAGRSVADAALLAGFADQSHLTRAFVRHFGVTPGRFKAALG